MSNLTPEQNAQFIIHKLPRPASGQILLTHDIDINDLQKLAKTGVRLSQDGDITDAIEVYKAINRPELNGLPFACTTAHIAETFRARSITACTVEAVT